ncbi:MAG: chloride channel protein [Kiloniellaceae bacterium]
MAHFDRAASGLLNPIRRLGRNDHVILSVLAVATGAAACLASIAFRDGIDLVQRLGFGFDGEAVATLAGALPWWHILLVPTAGGLAIGLFVYFFLPGRRPPTVADVIEANALRGGRMSMAVGVKSAVVSAASIGVGASVGREGPVVHLGASLGAWMAERLHLGRAQSRTLLGCGVAAAVAGSFNAPIAGALFALEVVVGHYSLAAFAPVVVASVTATVISRMHYGDFPAFNLPGLSTIASAWEFPGFVLLGVISALAAIVFMRAAMLVDDAWERTPVPGWARPAAAGLAVGAIALVFPQVLGVGYEATDAALSERYGLWLLMGLVVAKIAATSISLGSGFGGGVFSPSLFIGAMVGGAYGIIATSIFPDLSSGYSAYTIIGMGAVAGAVLGAPISTILIVFELTNDYTITIAVMIATSVASIITQQMYGFSFFTWQLDRRGVRVRGGHDIGAVRLTSARDVMTTDYATIAPETPIAAVRTRLQAAPGGELCVVDPQGRLTGVITYADLHEAAFDTSHDSELAAQDVARKQPAVLCADDDLEIAVKGFAASAEVNLPVVEDTQSMRVIGLAQEHAVMLAYHRALDQARAEERGGL